MEARAQDLTDHQFKVIFISILPEPLADKMLQNYDDLTDYDEMELKVLEMANREE